VVKIREDVIDFRKYAAILLGKWWLILALPALGGVAAFFYSASLDEVYEANATLLVRSSSASLSGSSVDFRQSGELASTYRRLVTARPFLERVVESEDVDFTLPNLESIVSAGIVLNPPVVEIRVRHGNPQVAASTAQSVADEFISYTIEQRLGEIARLQQAAAVQGITNTDALVSAQFSAIDSLSLLEPVRIPTSPVVPKTTQNIVVGIFLGLILAIGGALLLESMGDSIKSPDQIADLFNLSNLGTVPRWSDTDLASSTIFDRYSGTSQPAEAYRQVRTNLEFAAAPQEGNVFMVTSPSPGEGKSTTITNLAIALAQTGKRTIVVDADFRRANLHRTLPDIQREPGLSNVLVSSDVTWQTAVQSSGQTGLNVLAAGPTPPNPAELLGSVGMGNLIDELKQSYEIVLIDTPPVIPVADASIMASRVSGAVVVVEAFSTKPSALKAALGTLSNSRVNILGVILNKYKPPRFGSYGYQHYYYSSGYHYGESTDVHRNGVIGRIKKLANRIRKG
jgi:capsular exopolysaccharide synthesis family protein